MCSRGIVLLNRTLLGVRARVCVCMYMCVGVCVGGGGGGGRGARMRRACVCRIIASLLNLCTVKKRKV